MSRRLSILLTVVGFGLLWLALPRLPDDAGQLVRTRMLMGTVVEIRILDADAERFAAALDAAFDEMLRLEQLFSPHLEQSEVSRLSVDATQLTPSAETLEVLELGAGVGRDSDGAFDLGLGSLTRLWGFAEAAPRLPDATAIAAALDGVGVGDVVVEQGRVVKSRPQLGIDLGGVAKGYAIDRAVALLRAAGVEHASVNAGGDLRLIGDRGGRPWRIGIQHPRRPETILVRLELADRAVVTSGDYERTFAVDGKRYHHILDARTGYPATASQAVTVVAASAGLADALATAAFVLGPERGLELLAAQPGVEGMIVGADGEVVTTAGLKQVLQWP